MKTIRFADDATHEEGLRVIIHSGLVEYTGEKCVYRIPNYVVDLLDQKGIPYELVNTDHKSQPHRLGKSPEMT